MNPELPYHLDNAVLWDKTGNIYRCWDNRLTESYPFRKEELAEVDWRLPQLIDFLIEREGHQDGPFSIGNSIGLTLDYWFERCPLREYTDTDGGTRLVSAVIEINGLPGEGHVVFDVECFAKSELPMVGSTGPRKLEHYIEDTYRDSFCMSAEWMDAHYPGWSERMLAAQALGMPHKEQVAAILTPLLKTQDVRIDDVRFD